MSANPMFNLLQKGPMEKIGKKWSPESFDSMTQTLVDKTAKIPKAQRLDAMIKMIAALAPKLDPLATLERYILCQFVLAFHNQVGGLQYRQAVEVMDLMRGILKLRTKGKLTDNKWLAGEMHILFGQVYHSFGRRWEALWQQEYGLAYGTRQSGDWDSIGHFAMGNRLLRLGYACHAIPHYENALQRSKKQFDSINVSLVRAHFLSGNTGRSRELAAAMVGTCATADTETEIQWQLNLNRSLESQNLSYLLDPLTKGDRFSAASFALESALWIYAWPTAKFHRRAPSAKYLRRKFGAGGGKVKALLRCVEILQSLHTTKDMDQTSVIESIEYLLSNKGTLTTLDKEVALLLGLSRWLRGSKFERLTKVVSLELRGMGFRMTDRDGFDFWGLL